MKTRTAALILFGCSVACATMAAESTPATALLVLAKADNMLAIVDPASLQVIARVPVGPDPHEVVASADGKLAYVSNYGGGAYHTLAVVDLERQKALAPIDLGALNGPHGLEFVGGKVWFTAEGAKVIGSFDPATQKVDLVLGTGQNRTHMISVSDDLRRIITSNVSSATMTLIEKTRNDWNETVIPVGRGAEGFDVSPDGQEIWAANAQDGTISIVNLAAKKVTQTLPANVHGANRLKFTPDGKLVLVSMLGNPELAIFDAAKRSEAKRLKIGHGAAGILMQPDGARVFLACTPDNNVAIIDLKSWEITGHIQPGKGPDGLAWAVRH